MVRIIALLVILLVASAAQADWQYTKWGMSAAELEAFGQGNIVKASASSINPYNQGRSAGTTMAIDAADVVLTSGFKNEGITYDVLYYFSARGLFLVALIPKSVEDGLKTGKILDATYGAPDREERMGINENYTGCIVRRRWRAQRDGNLVTLFNLCGTRFELRYEPIPAKGGL
jgi:hypothetical protein